jgi:hypothetical protein
MWAGFPRPSVTVGDAKQLAPGNTPEDDLGTRYICLSKTDAKIKNKHICLNINLLMH